MPTGLFRFRTLTPPQMPSTVPQKLYHGQSYLATGYQGRTARLLPGTYTVRYHAPADERQARALRAWHVMGPFRANYTTERDLKRPCPPEQAPHDLTRSLTEGGRKLTWRKVYAADRLNLQSHARGAGFMYLAAEFEAAEAGTVQMIAFARGGMKVWLNGKLIRNVPMGQRTYITQRVEMFPQLRKGANRLMIKTFSANWMYTPFGVGLERWRSYEVTVRPGAAESRRIAAAVHKKLLNPILDAEEAFKTRCLECHDTRKLAALKTITPARLAPLMKRMIAKRRDWIKPQEVPLITGYINKNAKPRD